MLDSYLAKLYEVTTSNLNKAVRRNPERFPSDFMFQLNASEYQSLRFQFGILKRGQHSKYLPLAFTEQGVAMLSSVLNSPRAMLAHSLRVKPEVLSLAVAHRAETGRRFRQCIAVELVLIENGIITDPGEVFRKRVMETVSEKFSRSEGEKIK